MKKRPTEKEYRKSLFEDKGILEEMTPQERQEVYQQFLNVPFDMCKGGTNKGYETITQRFLMWRRGTRRDEIKYWFLWKGIEKK
jgi:hypothetical protein